MWISAGLRKPSPVKVRHQGHGRDSAMHEIAIPFKDGRRTTCQDRFTLTPVTCEATETRAARLQNAHLSALHPSHPVRPPLSSSEGWEMYI